MNYNELIQKVKELFVKRLYAVISEDAFKSNPSFSKDSYIDVIYTEIMSLGYNFGNIKLATSDIYEMKSILQGESKNLKSEIQKGLTETSQIYTLEIIAFSEFHKASQEGVNPKLLIENLVDKLKI